MQVAAMGLFLAVKQEVRKKWIGNNEKRTGKKSDARL
jgi:hypothetical protein